MHHMMHVICDIFLVSSIESFIVNHDMYDIVLHIVNDIPSYIMQCTILYIISFNEYYTL